MLAVSDPEYIYAIIKYRITSFYVRVYLCALCESYLCRIISAMHTLCKVNHAHFTCDAHAQVVYSCLHFGAAGYDIVEVFKSITTYGQRLGNWRGCHKRSSAVSLIEEL